MEIENENGQIVENPNEFKLNKRLQHNRKTIQILRVRVITVIVIKPAITLSS